MRVLALVAIAVFPMCRCTPPGGDLPHASGGGTVARIIDEGNLVVAGRGEPQLRYCCAVHIDGVARDAARVCAPLSLDCDTIRLEVDETGQRVAYADTLGWYLLELTGAGQAFESCSPPTVSDRPDFAQIEPLVRAWSAVLDCAEQPSLYALFAANGDGTTGTIIPALYAAIRIRHGEPAADDFLLGYGTTYQNQGDDDAWLGLLAERGGVAARFCDAALAPRAASVAFERAVRGCARDPRLDDAAAARILAVLAEPRADYRQSGWDEDVGALELAAAVLVHSGLPRGDVSSKTCAWITGATYGDDRWRGVGMLVAAGLAPCPAARLALIYNACRAQVGCTGGGCGAAAAASATAGIQHALDGPAVKLPRAEEVAVAAAYAGGGTQADFDRIAARASYDREVSACGDAPVDACDLPMDGSFVTIDGTCRVRANDAHRKLVALPLARPAAR